MTPKHQDFEHDVKLNVEARIREGVKAVLEEVLQEEMTQHLDIEDSCYSPEQCMEGVFSEGRVRHLV